MYRIKSVLRTGTVVLAFLGLVACASAPREKEGIVIQVSDNNPATWNQALNVAENVPTHYGVPLDVEVVAFGAGLNMLKYDSEVGHRLKTAAAKGVAIKACGVTMGKMKLKEKDLYPDASIGVVPAGVVEIMKKQKEGWYHIRP